MDIEKQIEQLNAMDRPALLKAAKAAGVSNLPNKSNVELIDEILERQATGQTPVVSCDQLLQAIGAALGERFKKHRHRAAAAGLELGTIIDLGWHEDLDEVQARVDKQQVVAAISLNGKLGHGRKDLAACLRDALRGLGMRVRLDGVTW
jgi:ABC-type sugar transport system ATPase subunit